MRDWVRIGAVVVVFVILMGIGYVSSPFSPSYVPRRGNDSGNVDIELNAVLGGSPVTAYAYVVVTTPNGSFRTGTPLLTALSVRFSGLTASSLGVRRINLTAVSFSVLNTELPAPAILVGPINVTLSPKGDTWTGNRTLQYLKVAEWTGIVYCVGRFADGSPTHFAFPVDASKLTVAPATGYFPAPLSNYYFASFLWAVATVILVAGVLTSEKRRSKKPRGRK